MLKCHSNNFLLRRIRLAYHRSTSSFHISASWCTCTVFYRFAGKKCDIHFKTFNTPTAMDWNQWCVPIITIKQECKHHHWCKRCWRGYTLCLSKEKIWRFFDPFQLYWNSGSTQSFILFHLDRRVFKWRLFEKHWHRKV